jgi:6-pyruvoyltetrahydropterin/6-carboxytetrahydropterin synthase
MYTIAKTFRFEGAHSLPSLPTSHKCYNLHGHSYSVTLYLRSEKLDQHGFIKDYGELVEFKQLIERDFDHKFVNETLAPIQTSAENLAKYFHGQACRYYPGLVWKVRVSESTSSWAEFESV